MGGDTPGIINAGLPNIEGKLSGELGGYIDSNIQETGALFTIQNSNATMSGGPQARCYLYFDASKSNAIYGLSPTVQPPALSLIPQIKF